MCSIAGQSGAVRSDLRALIHTRPSTVTLDSTHQLNFKCVMFWVLNVNIHQLGGVVAEAGEDVQRRGVHLGGHRRLQLRRGPGAQTVHQLLDLSGFKGGVRVIIRVKSSE